MAPRPARPDQVARRAAGVAPHCPGSAHTRPCDAACSGARWSLPPGALPPRPAIQRACVRCGQLGTSLAAVERNSSWRACTAPRGHTQHRELAGWWLPGRLRYVISLPDRIDRRPASSPCVTACMALLFGRESCDPLTRSSLVYSAAVRFIFHVTMTRSRVSLRTETRSRTHLRTYQGVAIDRRYGLHGLRPR